MKKINFTRLTVCCLIGLNLLVLESCKKSTPAATSTPTTPACTSTANTINIGTAATANLTGMSGQVIASNYTISSQAGKYPLITYTFISKPSASTTYNLTNAPAVPTDVQIQVSTAANSTYYSLSGGTVKIVVGATTTITGCNLTLSEATSGPTIAVSMDTVN